MSNKTNHRQSDYEERQTRIAHRKQKQHFGQVDLDDYKYEDEEDEFCLDDDMLYQIKKCLR